MQVHCATNSKTDFQIDSQIDSQIENKIVMGVESYPTTLDPRQTGDALSSKIETLLYNGLFTVNDHFEIVNDLARSVENISDVEFLIHLKPKVFFHDGSPLSTKDVLATYESLKRTDLHSPLKSSFDVFTFTIVDDLTLRVRLKKPSNSWKTLLRLAILPSSLVTSRAPFYPIGTGPYKYDSAVTGEKVTLGRFENFFDPEKRAQNEGIVFRTLSDDTTRTLELIRGGIDVTQNGIPLVLLPAVQKEHSLNIISEQGNNVSYLAFNLEKKILSHPLVRKALALGIDREKILRYKLYNKGQLADSVLPPKHWAHDPRLSPLLFNPNEAKKLLDQAGYPDPDGDGPLPRFKLTYKTSSKKDRIDLALLMADMLSQIGVEVKVESYEWGTFYRDIRQGNFELCSLTWVGVSDPEIFNYAFHSSQIPPVGANRGHYQNKEADQLIDKASQTTDQTEQLKLYAQIQKILSTDLPIFPLFYEDNVVVMNQKITNYQIDPSASFLSLVGVKKGN